jgi:hypothetical protein
VGFDERQREEEEEEERGATEQEPGGVAGYYNPKGIRLEGWGREGERHEETTTWAKRNT